MRGFIAAVLVALLLLSGCSDPLDGYFREPGTVPTEEAATYYNGYTGVSVTVPAGYYVAGFNGVNLTAAREESAYLSALDRYEYEDGGYCIELANLHTQADSGHDDHSEIDLYIDEYAGYFRDAGEYADYLVDSMGYSYSGYERFHTGSGTAELNGILFHTISYEVSHPDNGGDVFMEDYYITGVGKAEDGLFLIAYINYWPDSRKSVLDARYMLENCFRLESSSAGEERIVVV